MNPNVKFQQRLYKRDINYGRFCDCVYHNVLKAMYVTASKTIGKARLIGYVIEMVRRPIQSKKVFRSLKVRIVQNYCSEARYSFNVLANEIYTNY